MFKKMLSSLLCMLLLFFCNFSCVDAKSCKNCEKDAPSDVVVVCVEDKDSKISKKEIEKICKEQMKNSELDKDCKSSSKRWVNVLNHPFRIILRSGVWATLGGILGGIFFGAPGVVIAGITCALCGGATKAAHYYYQ